MYCEDYHFEPHVSSLSEDAPLSDAHIMTRRIFFGKPITTGSLSFATERMGISVSTLSHGLSDEEKEIGCTLYPRNNKTMPLTDAGDHLYRNLNNLSLGSTVKWG